MAGTKIAVLGTGIMGAPIARNLSNGGFDVRVWNRTRAKAEALAAAGATICDSPAQASSDVEFVLTMLSDGSAVESAMTGASGALPAMRADAIWLQCATVGIEATEHHAQLAEKASIAFVDAPVLGTKKPAEDAKLTILASGAAELETRCRPIFDAIGQKATWIGAAGTGSRLKLVMNSWVLAVTASVAEAIAMAEGFGLDPDLFLSTLAGSQVDTPYAHIKGEAMIKRDFTASFPTAGAAKDTGLIVEAARTAGITADVANAVHEKFVRAVGAGHGDNDMAAAYCVTAAS